MKNANTGRDLAPIEWVPPVYDAPSIDPLPAPKAIETEGRAAWACWDGAQHELDRNTPDGRALALWEAE